MVSSNQRNKTGLADITDIWFGQGQKPDIIKCGMIFIAA